MTVDHKPAGPTHIDYLTDTDPSLLVISYSADYNLLPLLIDHSPRTYRHEVQTSQGPIHIANTPAYFAIAISDPSRHRAIAYRVSKIKEKATDYSEYDAFVAILREYSPVDARFLDPKLDRQHLLAIADFPSMIHTHLNFGPERPGVTYTYGFREFVAENSPPRHVIVPKDSRQFGGMADAVAYIENGYPTT